VTKARALSDAERLDWVRLARTPNVGPVTFAQLMGRYASAGDALEALPGLSQRAGRSRKLIPPNVADIEKELDQTREHGARMIASCEPDYPPLLKSVSPPPPVLTCLGRTELAARPTVALVGARNASAAGRKIARDMAAQLGQSDLTIVSGMARGIDGESHAASLRTGTIAVLGGAVDHIYPSQHERLYAEIAAEGLIVSECAFGYRAKARDFPRRNRLITGLSRGVVVIEAAERSGSLISARTAGEQGREVMAVPGSPLDPRSAGSNKLIRDGALLVRDASDVLEALSSLSFGRMSAPNTPEFEVETQDGRPPESQIEQVRSALSPHPMSIDEIARSVGIGAARCAAVLMELELAGEAETLPGGLACITV
jgi:DNA processing protein